jgi:hypothetical protein
MVKERTLESRIKRRIDMSSSTTLKRLKIELGPTLSISKLSIDGFCPV